ncbi:hypothetical protein [Pedobacter steynii]|uniref:Uncharacterized protein n=1 Tax=Pedobacter steynii TaxID=430522 RepID=A0A1D7QFM5_9SPHI|nr:hypothetical protein [Pedobacter steynii]AOM77502.1 hypothetical protein BFS30_10180 [Pedobacter steynii]
MTIISKRKESSLKVSFVTFDLIYFIQMKRIACSLSQEELSFLIGRGNNFITERETFKMNKELWLGDISVMSMIFDCRPAEFFRKVRGKENEIRLLSRQSVLGDYIQYEVFGLRQDDSIELLYMINEEDPSKKYDDREKSFLLKIAKKEVTGLINEGYFAGIERGPFEIFRECRTRGGHLIKAYFVAQALNEYLLGTGRLAVLKKYKHKDKGFVYQGS